MVITADTVYKLRKVFRLTQAEFGALCGVSDAFINQIERGKRSVSERLRIRMIDKLELTPERVSHLLAVFNETKISIS